jgi:cold shock CspA family protein
MAKSQMTFNKKEREKKRLQTRQDKEQKKEDRKAQSDGGKKSLEDMIAYVDDNGNITSTPPDPSKKKAIQAENIRIGIAKQLPEDPALAIRTGTVTFFNESKGYGFIRDHQTQESLFVHVTGLDQPVKEKDKVTFEVGSGPKGPTAVKVKLAK